MILIQLCLQPAGPVKHFKTTNKRIDTSNDYATLATLSSTSHSTESSLHIIVGTPSIQAALGSVSARPTNNIVNTKSFYDVVFVTGKAGVIKFIQVTFPAGTTLPTSASFNEAEGIGPGFVSDVTGQTITYTVNNAINVPVGYKIRLEFSNINNPLNPSANYKVTVQLETQAIPLSMVQHDPLPIL